MDGEALAGRNLLLASEEGGGRGVSSCSEAVSSQQVNNGITAGFSEMAFGPPVSLRIRSTPLQQRKAIAGKLRLEKSKKKERLKQKYGTFPTRRLMKMHEE